jgi:integrase
VSKRTTSDHRLQTNGAYLQVAWKTFRKADGKPLVDSLGRADQYTKATLAAKINQLRQEHQARPAATLGAKAPTLEGWLTRYFELRSGKLAEGTLALHNESARRLKERFGTDTRIDKISRAQAAEWERWLETRRDKDGKPLLDEDKKPLTRSPATVCRHIRDAKVIFGMAVEQDLLPYNPFDRLVSTAPAVEKDWAELDESTVATLVQGAPTQAWKALIALCAYAGLRRGEAFRLKWADVHMDRNRLVVVPAANARGRRQTTTKQRRREVLMVPALEQILKGTKDTATGAAVVEMKCYRGTIHRDMVKIIQRAGLQPWADPFHTLRKWRDTSWKAEGIPEPIVDAWLGHSLEVSREHYFRVPESAYGPADGKNMVAELQRRLREAEAKLAAVESARKAS